MRAVACIVLALPILIVATVADAQQRAAKKNQLSDEALAARRACFEEAKVRAPGSDWTGAGLQSLRENAYRDCAQRKGIRP
jgi:hypothetical protein